MDRHAPTATRLCDAATDLACSGGLGAAGIRAVIRRAGANLNSVHYHFGSREALLDAALTGVLVPLNAARAQLLDALRDGSGLADVLAALYRPLFERALGPVHRQH